jgi:hypothetical protein
MKLETEFVKDKYVGCFHKLCPLRTTEFRSTVETKYS